MSNLHLPSQLTLEEMRRVLTAMQSQPSTAQSSPVSTLASPLSSGGGSGGGGLSGGAGAAGPTGATGPIGPAGPAGSSGGNLMVGMISEQELMTDNFGDPISDNDGYAMFGYKMSEVVLSGINNGIIGALVEG